MPPRDRSAAGLAAEVAALVEVASEKARRAERARVRRIVRRELATWEREYAEGRTGAGTAGRIAACHNILAALRERKGTKR